jgi:hypothetical protein
MKMHMKGWAVTLGIGAAAGAVAVMMLPKQCTARKVIRKAADTVEDAVQNAKYKLDQTLDM